MSTNLSLCLFCQLFSLMKHSRLNEHLRNTLINLAKIYLLNQSVICLGKLFLFQLKFLFPLSHRNKSGLLLHFYSNILWHLFFCFCFYMEWLLSLLKLKLVMLKKVKASNCFIMYSSTVRPQNVHTEIYIFTDLILLFFYHIILSTMFTIDLI